MPYFRRVDGTSNSPRRLTFAIIAAATCWTAFGFYEGSTSAPAPYAPVQSALPKSTLAVSGSAEHIPSANGEKIIYGEDDRKDVFEVMDEVRLQQADATCAIVFDTDLTQNEGGTFELTTVPYTIPDEFTGEPISPCEDEAFATQFTAAFCTAFLVAPDIVVTAGHCMFEQGGGSVPILGNTKFLFGFNMIDADTVVTEFQANQVYEGVEILGRNFEPDDTLDFAVVRLDRAVDPSVAVPLDYRREDTPAVGSLVGVIGHPTGLSKKIAFGDQTRVFDSSDEVFFIANTDTYGGNSGSPVFNAVTGQVEGILVRGSQDFVVDVDGDCFRSNKVSDDSAEAPDIGEECTKMTFIQGYIDGTMMDGEGEGEGISIPGCAVSPGQAGGAPSRTPADATIVLLAIVLILRARRPSAA